MSATRTTSQRDPVAVTIRVPLDLRDRYTRAIKAKDAEYDISKAVRQHMRETVEAYEHAQR